MVPQLISGILLAISARGTERGHAEGGDRVVGAYQLSVGPPGDLRGREKPLQEGQIRHQSPTH